MANPMPTVLLVSGKEGYFGVHEATKFFYLGHDLYTVDGRLVVPKPFSDSGWAADIGPGPTISANSLSVDGNSAAYVLRPADAYSMPAIYEASEENESAEPSTAMNKGEGKDGSDADTETSKHLTPRFNIPHGGAKGFAGSVPCSRMPSPNLSGISAPTTGLLRPSLSYTKLTDAIAYKNQGMNKSRFFKAPDTLNERATAFVADTASTSGSDSLAAGGSSAASRSSTPTPRVSTPKVHAPATDAAYTGLKTDVLAKGDDKKGSVAVYTRPQALYDPLEVGAPSIVKCALHGKDCHGRGVTQMNYTEEHLMQGGVEVDVPLMMLNKDVGTIAVDWTRLVNEEREKMK